MLEQLEPPVGWCDCGRWVWVVRSGLAVEPVSKGLAVVVLLADAAREDKTKRTTTPYFSFINGRLIQRC